MSYLRVLFDRLSEEDQSCYKVGLQSKPVSDWMICNSTQLVNDPGLRRFRPISLKTISR